MKRPTVPAPASPRARFYHWTDQTPYSHSGPDSHGEKTPNVFVLSDRDKPAFSQDAFVGLTVICESGKWRLTAHPGDVHALLVVSSAEEAMQAAPGVLLSVLRRQVAELETAIAAMEDQEKP